MSLRTVGLGFPPESAIPTKIGTCGDGMHVAFVPSPQAVADCECDRMMVGPMGPYAREMTRVVFLDVSMDGTAIGETRNFDARVAP